MNSPILNGQLSTPALSPISEHGSESQANGLSLDSVVVESAPTDDSKGSGFSQSRDRRHSSETKLRKLSSQQIHHLTTSPESLPLRPLDSENEIPASVINSSGLDETKARSSSLESKHHGHPSRASPRDVANQTHRDVFVDDLSSDAVPTIRELRPNTSVRSMSSPVIQRKHSSSKTSKVRPQLPPLKTEEAEISRSVAPVRTSPKYDRSPSPMPAIMPLPPLSLSTYLHLELSSARPSPLYIHRSVTADFPYESSRVKFERLLNFLVLPLSLEQVLWFGAVACLDAWLYTFTILPLRFLKASAIFSQWLLHNAGQESLDLATYVYGGVGRIWQRHRPVLVPDHRSRSASEAKRSRQPSSEHASRSTLTGRSKVHSPYRQPRKHPEHRHRRTRSTPSALMPNHKADLLQGLLIISSCTVLMWLDASRMYHSIRGQAAIKLYVIYNVLEVFDRLFSAIGQDVLECLFSKETLERTPEGRSKIFRPLWMFFLALAYNVIHSTALFYQVVTLNVAVNSYSNALLTLLMSNQFVEIKGTVFKKFEKENLFQLTCADVVERFQLWLMLLIIALRNIVEVGGLNISLSSAFFDSASTLTNNASSTHNTAVFPTMIPKAFTLLPHWTGEVLGPFLIVLGSEALVDWCKHAYITKFNNVKPNIYGRFLDVLAKDYYSHAFADQNLTKRLGLPVIPLSCLFIRACMQTYHMFLATHMPIPLPSSATSISLDTDSVNASPATTAALQHIDSVFRRALGRSSFGGGNSTSSWSPALLFQRWTLDDIIALTTMLTFFLAIYLLLLAFKLLLGISLLSFARRRYRGMKERERQSVDAQGRRVGGWGAVEVNEDKRRWIYEDDPDGLRDLREKENVRKARAEKGEMKLDGVDRYTMAAKRIW